MLPPDMDFHALRSHLGLSVAGAAALFGVTARAWEYWEIGERRPLGPALVLAGLLWARPELARVIAPLGRQASPPAAEGDASAADTGEGRIVA